MCVCARTETVTRKTLIPSLCRGARGLRPLSAWCWLLSSFSLSPPRPPCTSSPKGRLQRPASLASFRPRPRLPGPVLPAFPGLGPLRPCACSRAPLPSWGTPGGVGACALVWAQPRSAGCRGTAPAPEPGPSGSGPQHRQVPGGGGGNHLGPGALAASSLAGGEALWPTRSVNLACLFTLSLTSSHNTSPALCFGEGRLRLHLRGAPGTDGGSRERSRRLSPAPHLCTPLSTHRPLMWKGV